MRHNETYRLSLEDGKEQSVIQVCVPGKWKPKLKKPLATGNDRFSRTVSTNSEVKYFRVSYC